MFDSELLDKKVIGQRGRFQRIRRWWRGIHPDKGIITKGWTGLETVEEMDRLVPIYTFAVDAMNLGKSRYGCVENKTNAG